MKKLYGFLLAFVIGIAIAAAGISDPGIEKVSDKAEISSYDSLTIESISVTGVYFNDIETENPACPDGNIIFKNEVISVNNKYVFSPPFKYRRLAYASFIMHRAYSDTVKAKHLQLKFC